MSGSFWSFDFYVDVLGLSDREVRTMSVPSPFPTENRLLINDVAVTTKYEMRDEEMIGRIRRRLQRLCRAIPRAVGVYFPSYELMKCILKDADLGETFVEGERVEVEKLTEFLRSGRILCGVARGKLSEGVDLTSEGRSLLSGVIVVGLPYPKRSQLRGAVQRFYTRRFRGKGFRYAYTVPCLTALAQTMGRLIRSEEDRGVIVVMDWRMGRILKEMPSHTVEGLKRVEDLDEIEAMIREFDFEVEGDGR